MKNFVSTVAVLACAALTPAQDVWTTLGPAPINSGPYTGRVAALAASRTNANRIYVGGADGGVWRTDDAGTSWTAIGDYLPSTAVGALAIHPTDDATLWVGLGEANFANHSRYGFGIAKTTDAGATWTVAGSLELSGRTIARLQVDPGDPNRLFAAVSHAGGFPAKVAARGHPQADGPLGIFRSTDGGASWQQLTIGLPTDLSATDLVIDPRGNGTVYAAIGHIFGDARNGIYRSTDGGDRFTKLGGGLPTGSGVGRIALAVAPSQPSRLLTSVVRACTSTGGSASTLGVYRSDNGGSSWSQLGNAPSHHASYGWYLNTVAFAPNNPDVLLLGGYTGHRSTNGGSSWSTITPPHVDLHAWEFDAAGRLLSGNDGGIHRSTNLGSSWLALNNNLGLVQFYAGISLHPSLSGRVFGGTQDNGSLRRDTSNSWTSVLGGDGGYTSIDAQTGSRVFVEFQGTGNLYRSTDGGQSFRRSNSGISRGDRNCFLPPHEIHPSNPQLMIYGTQRIYRSTTGGSSWAPISGDLAGGSGAVQALAFAPSDPNTIWAVTNTGRVQVTRNGGGNWQQVYSGLFTWPRTRHSITVDPSDGARAYVAHGAFGVDQVLFTDDGGGSWRALDGNLPDVPAHCVALDPVAGGGPPILYLGTDRGVFRSTDHGRSWEAHGRLPNAPVIDLRADLARRRLVAATQGRGLWQIDLLPRSGHVPQSTHR